jgi:hypothetical protein
MKSALKTAVITAALAAAAALAACEKPIAAPDDKGVCWHVVTQKDGTLKFNKLASNVENMETCAATLEGMRIRFMRLGSPASEITGAYQNNFLFLQKEGVFYGRTLTSGRFPFLVRTGDGRLAIPGAMKQDPTNPPVMEPETAPAK